MKNKVQIAAIAADEAFLEALPPQELEGIITPVHFISSMDKPETLAFVKNTSKCTERAVLLPIPRNLITV